MLPRDRDLWLQHIVFAAMMSLDLTHRFISMSTAVGFGKVSISHSAIIRLDCDDITQCSLHITKAKQSSLISSMAQEQTFH